MAKVENITTALFYVLLLIYLGTVLGLPLFPNQDGPAHAYWASVTAELWKGSHTYDNFFTIKHVLPPYSFLAYGLIALNSVFLPITSEKILVCLYLLVFCCGFRYLLLSVWRESGTATLFAFPLALHKLVYMGFFNFCLGSAITLWVCGFWYRHHDQWSGKDAFFFLLLINLLLFTHPVPLLLSLLFCSIHLIISMVIKSQKFNEGWRSFGLLLRLHKRLLITLALASCSVFYIWLFTSADTINPPILELNRIRHKIFLLIGLKPLTPILAPEYRVILALILALVAFLAILPFWHRRKLRIEHSDILLLLSLVCALIYLVAPGEMSGSYYFDQRFPIFSALFLFAAAGAVSLPSLHRVLLGIVLFAASCFLLYEQITYSEPFLKDAVVMQQAPVKMTENMKGVLVRDEYQLSKPLNYDPFFWTGAYYFLRSKAILLNSPWSTLPIIMVGTVKQHPFDNLDPEDMLTFLALDANPEQPKEIDLIITVNDSANPSESATALLVAKRYGLQRMPWSNRSFTFYAKAEN